MKEAQVYRRQLCECKDEACGMAVDDYLPPWRGFFSKDNDQLVDALIEKGEDCWYELLP